MLTMRVGVRVSRRAAFWIRGRERAWGTCIGGDGEGDGFVIGERGSSEEEEMEVEWGVEWRGEGERERMKGRVGLRRSARQRSRAVIIKGDRAGGGGCLGRWVMFAKDWGQ